MTKKASKTKSHPVRLGKWTFGAGRPLFLIAGPCVIESEAKAMKHARAIQRIAKRLGMPYVYKSSYDKANRSSGASFRGLGIDRGLAILRRVKEETGLPILTDVHSAGEVEKAARIADILQIPAFLCRQTDLLAAAADTGRIVNVKKGQFLAPWDMKNIVDKITARKNHRILLTDRGTSFGYNTLVSDLRAIPIMKEWGYPVVFDATHSVQQPGGRGDSSGGERRFVPVLAQAAVAAGADGIFMEVHEDPDHAPSDGPNMVALKDLERLLTRLLRIGRAAGNGGF